MHFQVTLALLSLTAIYLLQQPDQKKRRWGSVWGLTSQPFWLYETWMADQMGMFALACIYTILYIWGIYVNFRKDTVEAASTLAGEG